MKSRRFTLILISVLVTLPCAAALAPTRGEPRASPDGPVRCDIHGSTDGRAGCEPRRPSANRQRGVARSQRASRSGSSRSRARGLESSPAATRSSAAAASVARPTGDSRSPAPRARATAVHSWRITGESGAYRCAHGTALVRDIGDRESLITATVTPRAGTVLRVAVLVRPAANADPYRPRRSDLHLRVATVGALPPFPFSNFDPLHPISRCCLRSAHSSPARVTRVRSFKP